MEDDENSQIIQPQPRRPAPPHLSLTPIPTSSEASPNEQSPDNLSSDFEYMDSISTESSMASGKANGQSRNRDAGADRLQSQQESRSILNLTSSTLLGIYSPTGYEPNRDEPITPLGTGAQTPASATSTDARRGFPIFTAEAFKEKAEIGAERRRERRKSMQQRMRQSRRPGFGSVVLSVGLRTAVLFVFGVTYSDVITRLHNTGRVAPVQIDRIDRYSWVYHSFWGLTGVFLGAALPYLDSRWETSSARKIGYEDEHDHSGHNIAIVDKDEKSEDKAPANIQQGSFTTEWSDIVRCVGAFVGIAFAIRKLSWQSTLQVSLTLALINPAIWYLIDRTRTGLFLSSGVGVIGAAIMLGINPDWVPAPAIAAPHSAAAQSSFVTSAPAAGASVREQTGQRYSLLVGTLSYESIGVATWICSVLFCSCIFFGNIGRRLWTR